MKAIEKNKKKFDATISNKIRDACKKNDFDNFKLILSENNILLVHMEHAICYACAYGNLRMVKYLFLQNPNIVYVNNAEDYALYWASVGKSLEVAKFLITSTELLKNANPSNINLDKITIDKLTNEVLEFIKIVKKIKEEKEHLDNQKDNQSQNIKRKVSGIL